MHQERRAIPRRTEDKMLAELFWTDRWTGSRGFGLPQEARGIYREMLTQAWRRQARLPNNHEEIRRYTGTTEKEWKRSWPKVEPFWRVDGDDLVNDTQIAIYEKAQASWDATKARAQAGGEGKARADRERRLRTA